MLTVVLCVFHPLSTVTLHAEIEFSTDVHG